MVDEIKSEQIDLTETSLSLVHRQRMLLAHLSLSDSHVVEY